MKEPTPSTPRTARPARLAASCGRKILRCRWFSRRALQGLLWGALVAVGGLGARDARAAGLGVAAPEPVSVGPVRYFLDTVQGKSGEKVTLTLSLVTKTQLKAIHVAINFDETNLRLETATRAGILPGLPLEDVARTEIDNRNIEIGDQDEEGWIILELVASETIGELKWPLGEVIKVYEFHFQVLPTARPGLKPVTFAAVGPKGTDAPLGNAVVVRDEDLVPVNQAVPVEPEDLKDGGVVVLGLGEIGFFLRGDVNLDRERDISDPVRTLTHLFKSDTQILCLDAADANDDGALDVSDAVFTLHWLYASGKPPPEPEEWGPDPTPDKLCCEDTGGCY